MRGVLLSLCLLYILYATLNVPLYSVEVSTFDGKGFLYNEFISQEQLDVEFAGQEVYETFSVESDDFEEQLNLRFSMVGLWPQPEEVFLYKLIDESYERVAHDLVFTDKGKAVYESKSIGEGVYVISIPTPERHLGAAIGITILVLLAGFFLQYHHHSTKDVRRHKVDVKVERLDSYLRDALVKGHNEREITFALERAGWDDKTIYDGLRRVRFF